MDDILYCFSFSDFSENGEVVPELLTALGYDFSSWRDAETKKLAHTLYFKTREEADGKYVVCFVHGQPPCLFRC